MKRFFLFFFFLTPFTLLANNIQVTNVTLANNTGTAVDIQFDLNWQNSWRGSGAPNHDAAWVFVKFRLSNGVWQHARLANTGHVAASGSLVEPGLLAPGSAFNTISNPVLGTFIRRDADGTGTFNAPGTQLRWNYVDQLALFGDVAEVRVFAIEMVFVNQGSFFLGSAGSEVGSFTNGTWTTGPAIPLQITSENALTIGQSPGALYSTNNNSDSGVGANGTLPSAFPKGFRSFYCMKYEVSQQQYVDFLNTLSRVQQNARTATDLSPGITSVIMINVMTGLGVAQQRNGIRCANTIDANGPIPFFCDLGGNGVGGEVNDGQNVACNFLGWGDQAAYMDWSGLRPMSELEFEKACRGPLPSFPEEFPWGTAGVATTAYTYSFITQSTEGISTNYSTAFGNALYNTVQGTLNGPARVGLFAANAANTGRMTSGASYYGIMQLGDNVRERPVTVGNTTGRIFNGDHGNGELSSAGTNDVLTWPADDAVGSGFRGTWWQGASGFMRVSDRSFAATTSLLKANDRGGRGVRTAP